MEKTMDIRHSPVPSDLLTEFTCSNCSMPLPQPICLIAMGAEVVEIGGGLGFVPDDGTPGTIPCTHPSATHQRAEASLIDENIEATAPEIQSGETIKEAHPLTEFERRANSGFETWAQLRELTRPEGT